ncbi:hypothetical protein GMI70_10305 [Eggerthellaceae bacterium zg-893]|nr:hypothetical protein [Eggerthellaceae bacterium zg-893]
MVETVIERLAATLGFWLLLGRCDGATGRNMLQFRHWRSPRVVNMGGRRLVFG